MFSNRLYSLLLMPFTMAEYHDFQEACLKICPHPDGEVNYTFFSEQRISDRILNKISWKASLGLVADSRIISDQHIVQGVQCANARLTHAQFLLEWSAISNDSLNSNTV
jgi:hypothetical protein